MSFTVSPGISIREVGVQGAVRAATASVGGFAGAFRWGPVDVIKTVIDENDLVDTFGQPNDNNYIDFLVCSQFLGYSDSLRVNRIIDEDNALNATVDGSGFLIKNEDDYDNATLSNTSAFYARYPGELGNSLAVSVATDAAEYNTTLPGTFSFTVGSKTVAYTPSGTEALSEFFQFRSFIVVDGTRYRVQDVDDGANELTLFRSYAGDPSPTSVAAEWRFATQFGAAPETDKLHIVVLDEDGEITGEEGTILESYANLTTTQGTTFPSGAASYWRTAINRQSQWVWAGGISDITTINTNDVAEVKSLSGGTSANDQLELSDRMDGWDKFLAEEQSDVGLLIGGETTPTLANYIIESIAADRKDAVAFISPEFDDVVNNKGNEKSDVIAFRNNLSFGKDGSYAVLDDNWKYVYDRYNDKFRWIPLNGDTAGVTARNDRVAAPWFSPAGFNRGQIRNVVKLAWNPEQPIRDELYSNDINPVATIRGRGTVLFGDKTLGDRPFDRINVRRLFIIVEQTVERASQDLLFEFNDEFTRSQFIALVDPFLRRIQGERGIIAFQIVADASVNTPQVVGNNQFIGQIYIQPAEAINFIRLDFVNVESGISIDEVVGSV